MYPSGKYPEIRDALDHPPTDTGLEPAVVVEQLARELEPYITAHNSGRYFGFAIGGLHPASWGAEILVSTWDQNGALFPPTPGVAVVEELAAEWLVDLLGLPPQSSVGFVTGGQMATFTCLAAARHELLQSAGWNVEADGLTGAPPPRHELDHSNVKRGSGNHVLSGGHDQCQSSLPQRRRLDRDKECFAELKRLARNGNVDHRGRLVARSSAARPGSA